MGIQFFFGDTTFYWRKVGLDTSEFEEQQLAVYCEITLHETFRLHQNYPNPVTNISYELLEKSFVNITIYDLRGNVVNKLVNSNQPSGYKTLEWKAKNNQGQPVSAGVYLYSVYLGEFRETKKMVLLK